MIKRFAFWFGVAGYFLTFLYYKGPHPFSYSQTLGHALPYWGCYFALGGMPVGAVLMDFAPVNAAIYAIVGAGVGWSFSKLGVRQNSPRPRNG